MKQAYQINFEGFQFYIDEDARIVFYEFIENTEKLFSQDPEQKNKWEAFKKELRKAIEIKVLSDDKVLNINELEDIINKLTADFTIHNKTRSNNRNRESKSRLYRANISPVIGGVCEGLSIYFGIDVAWVRVLFLILLFTPVGLIGYIILWIAMPTTDGTQTNNTHSSQKQNNQTGPGGVIRAFFRGIGNLIMALFKSVGFLIGIILILVGIFILFGMFNIMPWQFFHGIHIPRWNPNWHMSFNGFHHANFLFLVCIAFLIIIPLVSLIIGLVGSLFNVKNKSNLFKNSMRFLWLLCFLAIIALLVTDNSFTESVSSSEESNLQQTTYNTVYIDIDRNSGYYDYDRNDSYNITVREKDFFMYYGYVHDYGDKILYGKPKIKVKHSDYPTTNQIIIEKMAFIGEREEINRELENIVYHWEQTDSLIILDQYFYSKDLRWWNFPQIEIEIIVPNNKNVMFTENYHQTMDR